MIEIARIEAARFIRFAFVGGTGFVIDAGLLTLFHNGIGFDPFTARLMSIAVAAFTTWQLNRSITFGASGRGQASEALLYAIVAGITAGLNYCIYAVALIVWPALPPIAALIGATLAAMFFSYTGYSRFVFAGAATSLGAPSSQRR